MRKCVKTSPPGLPFVRGARREIYIAVRNSCADEGLPRLRAGVAAGEAVSRAGDWFGRPVNVASRITAVARPGTVLAAESARDSTGSVLFDWTPVGTRHLKGVRGEAKLFRVSHSTTIRR